MIICGFPGIGKSTLAKRSGWVDLESTPFERDWERYAKVAEHMDENGYNVMVSTHKELISMLCTMGVDHTIVIPAREDRGEYIRRYIVRGNSEEFIGLLDDNFEKWINDIISHSNVFSTLVILPRGGYLSDYINNIQYDIGEKEE